ncbi:MAG: DNA mismatch repair protein MutS [Acidobacteriota bacterium]|nr:MAG: DNA mismatch repair protein MutS [Acidobacteriota bacterium]
MSELTPILRQYHEIKSRHKDAILLFRLGDFYEMFYEDAELGARELELALTARHRGTPNETPMCGFPAKAADSYIQRLVKRGHRVAICEQLSDPKESRGPVDRDVVRIVTPGTATEDALLEPKANAFLASIYSTKKGYGAAFVDVSTGEFHVLEAREMQELLDAVAQFAPKEILYPEDSPCRLTLEGEDDPAYTPLPPDLFRLKDAERSMREQFEDPAALEASGVVKRPLAVQAAGALLSYLRRTQKRPLPHLREVHVLEGAAVVLDSTTQRNLEIFRNLQDGGTAGTLFSVLDRTETAMGGRLLRQWTVRPLAHKREIEARLDAVEEFLKKPTERGAFRERLERILDIERLTGRIAMSTANARDLAALRVSLEAVGPLRAMLAPFRSSLVETLRDALDPLEDVHALLGRALVDEPPVALREGGLIREGYDAGLDERRTLQRDAKKYLSDLEARERRATGIDTLRVGYNRVHGYYIEITKARAAKAPPHYERRQTLVNAERYITPELKEYEAKLLGAEDWSREREYELFCSLRAEAARHAERLLRTARALAALDALAALADAAHRFGYVRPRITEDSRLEVRAGRHPVVERIAARDGFVPNDLKLDNDSRQILLITGPNMGGKSTYLRQAALLVLMAQMGSFVAAQEAEVGLVDRVFTRVGASDNLARGQSTFMVEMSETANILRSATTRSLIVLDEVGRGTSTFDGVSLAWAIVEHLHETPGVAAKTLFATHYLELTELARVLPRVQNAHFTAKEWRDRVIFLRKVEPGAADRSYGIHVAQLAGLPESAVARAREVLRNLEEGAFLLDGSPALLQGEHRPAAARTEQPSLFQEVETDALEALRKANVEEMTPVEALAFLAKLRDGLPNRRKKG